MSDFSDRPFVAGSLTGLRAFSVDTLGRLRGPSHGSVFKPGDNEAQCVGGPRGFSLPKGARLKTEHYGLWSEPTYEVSLPSGKSVTAFGSVDLTAKYPDPKHIVGSEKCTCGFYAYFNGENTYAKKDRVTALIEGYGVCTVGEKGFRAGKARLVALVLPSPRRFFGTWRSAAAWVALFVVLGVVNLARHKWLVAGIDAFIVAVWTTNLLVRIRDSRTARDIAKVAHLVRRNYPDVPTYKSVKAALRKHPLTPPPPPPLPSPADEDFWTRTVKS